MIELEIDDLLTSAGLTDPGPFEPVFSYSNDVWVGREVVLRISRPSDKRDAQQNEREVLGWLPPTVPHATVLASGLHAGRHWLALERLPGQVLGRLWPTMTANQRRAVIVQLGAALRALHHVPIPADWQRADLRPAALTRADIALNRHPFQPPPDRIEALAEGAGALRGVDGGLVNACAELVRERLPLFEDDPRVLVHTDVHWENLMSDGTSLTGLLDFESAQAGPPDLELDTLLRFTRWPHLPAAEAYDHLLVPEDFRRVPEWLAESYPLLFAVPRLRERLEVYSILYDLRLGIRYPETPHRPDRPWSPWNRMRDILAGTSYLNDWL